MKVLLDTCVISELIAKQPNPNVIDFIDSLDADDVYLSVITIGEISKGIEKLIKSRRKTELQTWLKESLLVRFDGKIISLDADVLMTWGRLTANLEVKGHVMPAIDSLIAATVLTHQMPLVTRNVKDFENSGVEIIDPWK